MSLSNLSILCSDTVPLRKCRDFVEAACEQALTHGIKYSLIPDKKCLFFNRDLYFLCLKSAFDYYDHPDEIFVSLIFNFETGMVQMMCGILTERGILCMSKIFIEDSFFGEVSGGILKIRHPGDAPEGGKAA